MSVTASFTVPLGANLDIVQTVLKTAFPALKFDGTDGSFVNASMGASNISVTITAPDGTNLTPATIQSAYTTTKTARDNVRTAIMNACQALAGQAANALAAPDVRTILGGVLLTVGAIDDSGKIQPAASWIH